MNASVRKCGLNYCYLISCHRLRHRGPDWSGLHQHGDCYLAHQRLAIVDPASGDQPLFNEDKTVAVTVGHTFNKKLSLLLLIYSNMVYWTKIEFIHFWLA